MLAASEVHQCLGTYLKEMTDNFSNAHAGAHSSQHPESTKQTELKVNHDNKVTVLLFAVEIKFFYTTTALHKLALPNKGPYVITRTSSTNAYVCLDSNAKGKEICVAWERLRPCMPT